MGFITPDVERKTFSILQVLANTPKPLGSIVIARELKDRGVELGERAVRYHLKLTDEHGLTRLAGRRDGREITPLGIKELKQGMVKEKIGFSLSRIESLAFRTTFDLDKLSGLVPVNVSFIRKRDYQKALNLMKPVFSAGWCASSMVAQISSGERLGELTVPQGFTALATVCSVVVNSALLKVGVPVNSKFGGLLQLQDGKPWRFVDLIHYSGCSLDPSEVFIRAGMTSVTQAVKSGNGSILANFREMPSLCRPIAQEVIAKLARAGLNATLLCGLAGEPLCEIDMEFNRAGLILTGGLNPIASAEEAGIHIESHAMSTLINYENLVDFDSLLK